MLSLSYTYRAFAKRVTWRLERGSGEAKTFRLFPEAALTRGKQGSTGRGKMWETGKKGRFRRRQRSLVHARTTREEVARCGNDAGARVLFLPSPRALITPSTFSLFFPLSLHPRASCLALSPFVMPRMTSVPGEQRWVSQKETSLRERRDKKGGERKKEEGNKGTRRLSRNNKGPDERGWDPFRSVAGGAPPARKNRNNKKMGILGKKVDHTLVSLMFGPRSERCWALQWPALIFNVLPVSHKHAVLFIRRYRGPLPSSLTVVSAVVFSRGVLRRVRHVWLPGLPLVTRKAGRRALPKGTLRVVPGRGVLQPRVHGVMGVAGYYPTAVRDY